MWRGGEWFKVERQKRIGKSLKLIRKYRRWEERLNQSVLSRRGEGGAYLGHEANLLGRIHQPDEISLEPLWSGDTSSIPYLFPPPPSHTARVRFRRTSALGDGPLWGWAPVESAGAAQEISIPLGSFFKVLRPSPPHQKNFKQIQVLCFSAQGPHKSATWKEREGSKRKGNKERPTTRLSLILLGQGEPECEAAGRSAPCFKFTCWALAFCVLVFCSPSSPQTNCRLANARVQVSGEESCFTAFNCTFVATDMTFEDGEDNDINKDRWDANRDISLPTEATNNLSRPALPLQPPDIFNTDITSPFGGCPIAVWYGDAAWQEETDPLVIIADFYTVITVNFMTERHQPSFSFSSLNLAVYKV